MTTKLQNAPFTIDAEAIAEGLFEMFDENERVALRFGMLPAEKMRIIEQALREKFLSVSKRTTPEDYGSLEVKWDGDTYVAVTNIPGRTFVEFSMKKLVNEATHAVCLALYGIGDLVV